MFWSKYVVGRKKIGLIKLICTDSLTLLKYYQINQIDMIQIEDGDCEGQLWLDGQLVITNSHPCQGHKQLNVYMCGDYHGGPLDGEIQNFIFQPSLN